MPEIASENHTPRLEFRPPGDLIPYARNSRTHTETQIAKVAGSIREFGFTSPVLIDDDNGIIAGHARVQAALKLRLELVPVIRLSTLTPTQRRAYVIADNRLAEDAGWDEEMLSLELQDLRDAGFDLELTGLDADELADLLLEDDAPTGDAEEVPEVAEVAVSSAGEVWLLGRHRLVCGDSTDPAAVAAVLDGARPLLMVTDPPYGVEYDAEWRSDAGLQESGAYGTVANDDRADWREAWRLFAGDVAYVWHAGVHTVTVAQSLTEGAGFELRALIVWAKNQLVISRGHYHHQHEPCWYAVRKGATANWHGDRKQTTLWEIDKPKRSETGHSTQKPIDCMARAIENHTIPGDGVYDPFLGSGTTLIACEQMGRTCFGVELKPVFVDVIIRRWQEFTGRSAVRESDSVEFNTLDSVKTA